MSMLSLCPITFAEAAEFIRQFHRHHQPAQGWKFGIGCEEEGKVVGVCCVGRPVARALDDGWTLEVTRLCTDGTRNACSKLYTAAWTATKSMGYRRLITYTLPSEGGASLRACGWKTLYTTPGRSWDVPSRPRTDKHPLGPRLLWEAC